MTGLFSFLLLASLFALAIGLIKPSWIRLPSRKNVGLLWGVSSLVFFILIGITAPPVSQEEKKKETTPIVNKKIEKVVPAAKEVAYLNQKNFKFLCSKNENDGHISDYFEVTTNPNLGTHLLLKNKVTDVTIQISKVESIGGWNTESLCGKDSLIDLPISKWQMLIPGKDCGLGALTEPCDLDTVSDDKGITEFIFGPEMNGYTTRNIIDFFKKGALIKVSGSPR